MKIDYRKEAGSNYMIISDLDDVGSSFSRKMLLSVSAPGLIPLKTENINGKTLFLYDISGKQSFEKAFETGKLTYDLLLTLVESLRELTLDLGEHLLDEDLILLSPETLFLDRSYNKFYFCCHPGAASCSAYGAESFFSSLPSMIDYEDKQLVSLTFGINRLFQTDNFTLRDIFEEVERIISPSDENPPLSAGDDVRPGSSLPDNLAGARSKNTEASFFDKAKVYFKGRSFPEIYDAINSGKIIRLIKNTRLPAQAPSPLPVADAADTSYHSETLEPSASDEPNRISDTASLNPSDLPFHRLTGIENALGMVIILDHFPFTIGSPGSPADHHLDWPTVSRLHCRIYEDAADTFAMEDLNSKNGSSVNNISLTPYEKTPLNPGDTITLSDLKFIFF